MAINGNPKIKELPLGPLTSRIATALAKQGLETYVDLVEHWQTKGKIPIGNGIGFASEAVLNDWLWEQPIGIPGSRRGEPAKPSNGREVATPVKSNSFSITTPGMFLSDKIAAATASVADDMKEVAKEQFRQGAVVIEP